MRSVRSQKFPIVSFIVCLIAVMILCVLGTWQIERLQWKNDLQQNLDAAFATDSPEPFTTEEFQNFQRGQVVRGTALGQLDITRAVLFHGRIQDGKSVMTVIAPMRIASIGTVIPVEIGCGASPKAEDLQVLQDQHVTVIGVLRQPRWSFATPSNNPDKGEWWRIDTEELGKYWDVQGLKNAVITAENTANLVPNLTACPIEKKLRNDHASYAFFWFTMAGVLAIIWGIRFLKPYLQSA